MDGIASIIIGVAVILFFLYTKDKAEHKTLAKKKEIDKLTLFLKEHINVTTYGSIFDDFTVAIFDHDAYVLILDKNFNPVKEIDGYPIWNGIDISILSSKLRFEMSLELVPYEIEEIIIKVATFLIKEYREKNIQLILKEKERQEKLYDNALFFLSYCFNKYLPTLQMKYKQTHYTDDYGNTIDKGWYKELKYFYKHSILTSASNFETINQFLIQINGVELEYPEELCDKIKEILELDENILEQKLNIAYKIAVDDLTPKPVYESTVNSGTDYEIFIEQILKNADFTVTRTPKTGDQGVDLVVQKNDKRIAIQCKYYSKPVGNKAVQEVAAGKDFYNCNSACVVSNNSFTLAARKLASNLNILLLNEDCLVEQLNFLITQK